MVEVSHDPAAGLFTFAHVDHLSMVTTKKARRFRVISPNQPPSRSSRRTPRLDWVHQFVIILASTDPLVWRRIQVPESYSFWDLHVAIQDAMGWSDCHLHAFKMLTDGERGGVERIGLPAYEFGDERPVRPGWTVHLSDVVRRGDLPMLYEYDFGDDWQHLVMYEGPAAVERGITYPRCVSGARRCPPEDCGGPHGFAELLEAIRDPTHERHDELLEWLGGSFDPESFDASGVRFDDPKKRFKRAFGDRG
jgi:hypothetical protein